MLAQRSKWIWPLAAYIGLMLPIAAFDLDWKLANTWFQLQGQQWLLKKHWLTQALLHDGGHDLAVTLYLLLLLNYLASLRLNRLKPYRHGLSYLSLSLPLATLSVSAIKRLTWVDCPWSVIEFGGEHPYQFWLQSLWSPLVDADHCFPAGHASSAYMFFGLYFVTRHYWPQHAAKVCGGVITLGLLFGFAQQLRGAHFVSHDLTTIFICWMVTQGLWEYWQKSILLPRPQPEEA